MWPSRQPEIGGFRRHYSRDALLQPGHLRATSMPRLASPAEKRGPDTIRSEPQPASCGKDPPPWSEARSHKEGDLLLAECLTGDRAPPDLTSRYTQLTRREAGCRMRGASFEDGAKLTAEGLSA